MILKPHNYVAKDLRTVKYRMQVTSSGKTYDRKKYKNNFKRELNGYNFR